MDIVKTRRLISAFGQWRQVIELVNEKAKIQHLRNTQINSSILSENRDAIMDDIQSWSSKSRAVRFALVNNYGPQLTTKAWPAVVEVTVVDPHFLVLALEHCYGAVKSLRGELDPSVHQNAFNAIDAYCGLWRAIRDLRHALEHEEEYIAGAGRRPELCDPDWTGGPLIGRSRQMTFNESGIDSIEALGKFYNVGRAVRCCLDRVAPRLSEIMTPLCKWPHTS